MSKIIPIRAKSLSNKHLSNYQAWLVDQVFWFLMVDRSISQDQLVLALGYPGQAHEIDAIRAWVQENQGELNNLTPWEGVKMACKVLGERLDDYYGSRHWKCPNQYER